VTWSPLGLFFNQVFYYHYYTFVFYLSALKDISLFHCLCTYICSSCKPKNCEISENLFCFCLSTQSVWLHGDMQNTVFRSHVSLKKYQAIAVQKLLILSLVAHGIVSQLTTQARSSCPCALWEDALRHRWQGVRGDGCWKMWGLSENSGDNLGFLGPRHVPLQVWWQEQRQRVVSVREHFLFKGEVGMLLAHLILPLYPSQKGQTALGHIAILNRCRRIQTPTCTHLQAYRVIN